MYLRQKVYPCMYLRQKVEQQQQQQQQLRVFAQKDKKIENWKRIQHLGGGGKDKQTIRGGG